MTDNISYDDVFVRTGGETIAILVSGELPDGTPVYPPNQLYGQDQQGTLRPFWVERVTNGFSVITTDHGLIHAGVAYTLSGFLSLTAGQIGAIAISCPADSYFHFKPASVGATGSAKIILRESATFAGGTVITPRNRNRRYPDASIATCRSIITPTLTGTQTQIAHGLIPGGGAGASKVGGSAQSAEEHVLKDTLEYVLTVENIAGSSIEVLYDLFWYEEGGA